MSESTKLTLTPFCKQTDAKDTTVPPPPLSEYAQHLMAPIITLFVGQERTKLHVHEDLLCKLEFFQACLSGYFREASAKTINMPEDHPNIVSALVEYLHTKSYTYPYEAKEPQESTKQSEVGVGGVSELTEDFDEGLFHLAVYELAWKYIYEKLIEVAQKRLHVVMGRLNDIDILRLWKAAYAIDSHFTSPIPVLPPAFDPWHQTPVSARAKRRENTILWVKTLFKEHSKEMETTILEFPGLACKILRVIAAT